MSVWPKAPLSVVCSLVTDGTHHSPPNYNTGAYRYVTAKNIRPWGLDLGDITFVDEATHREIYSRCPVEAGDVLYIKDGVTTGLAAINTLSEPFSLLSSVALLKPIREVVFPGYLKHWLNSPNTKREMTSGMTGTAIKRLVLKQIRAAEIPIAPLNEQRRIAEKLDTVLTRVDSVNARLARIAPLLKRFRQSVLAAATSGSLTEDWRKACGSIYANGTTLQAVCEKNRVITYGVVKLGEETVGGVPCLRTSNVRWLRFEVDGMKLIAPEISKEYGRTVLRGNEVLVNVRGTLGGVAVATPDMIGWNVSREVAVVPIDETLAFSKFIAFWIASEACQRWLTGVSKGVAYTGINIEDLRTLPLQLPMKDEQAEIIRRVETLFAFSERLEARLQTAQSSASCLTSSILAKAFRGELVPQDPADEPAAELLKRMAEARPASKVTKKRPGRAVTPVSPV